MAFVVDTTKFQAEGAFLQWQVIAKRLGVLDFANRDLLPVLQLRWTLHPELGSARTIRHVRSCAGQNGRGLPKREAA